MRQNWPIVWRFIAIGVIWGSGFVWADIALGGLSWQLLTWSRALIAVLALAVIVALQRPRMPQGNVLPRSWHTWLHFGVVGVLLAAVPNAFWALGQLGVSASLASIYNATIPLATALMAGLVFRVDRLGRRQWLGVLLGVIGVLVVVAPWEGDLGGGLWNQLSCGVAVFSVASAFAYQRKFLAETPMHPTTAALLITVGAAAVSLLMTPFWLVGPVSTDPMVWAGVLWLAVLGGGFAYIWNTRVIQAWGATGASMVTYLSPLVGITLGVLVLGDSLSWHAPVGGAVVIAGIAVSQSRVRG